MPAASRSLGTTGRGPAVRVTGALPGLAGTVAAVGRRGRVRPRDRGSAEQGGQGRRDDQGTLHRFSSIFRGRPGPRLTSGSVVGSSVSTITYRTCPGGRSARALSSSSNWAPG